jgi:DNA-binding SARP family transcriptional activator
MTAPTIRRAVAAAGLLASLAGLPVLLGAVAGRPTLAGLPSWGWVADGLRDQYLPVDPLLAALGVLAWGLWAYAVLVVLLRLAAVLAARRGLAGSAGLLTFSNLVTLPPIRSLVDAAVGVSLLASAPHAVAAPATLAGPPAVVRTLEASAGWERAPTVLAAVDADTARTPPDGPAQVPRPPSEASAPDSRDPECPPTSTDDRVYAVQEGDSLWRIAERELGDGHRWREIFARNHGRRMPDGHVLRDSGLILPGWQLLLPTPPDQPAPSPAPAPTRPAPPADRPEPPPPPSPAPPTTPSAPPTPAPLAPPATPPGPPAPPSPTADRVDRRQEDRRDVVELPSGSMVGLSLAVGIAAALAVAGLRRRRRRRPLWPSAPAQRAAGRATGETARLLAFAAARATRPADPDTVEPPDPPPAPRLPAAPRDPRDPTPARVTIAERAGQEVTVDLAGHGAIAILGPGAEGLARAALVGLLAAGGPAAVEVLLVGDRLIPGASGFPGLRRAAGLPGALNVLESELVHRARLLEDEDAPDFATHRRQHPDDPLPALVLVVDGVSLEQAGRLSAILAQGSRLGVGALLPGASLEGGARLLLDETGQLQAAAPWELGGDQELVGARVCSLTGVEAAELLGVLARSRTDDAEPADLDRADVPADADLPAMAGPGGQPAAGAGEPPEEPAGPPAEYGKTDALVQVRLLGPFQITTKTGEVRSGLRASARELLAYYLVHPDGASLEQAVDAMWPDTQLGRERERFWTALGNLRSVLRKATGTTELKAIQRAGDRYRVDPAVFAVDLWRFQAALAAARRAQLDTAIAAALAAAGEAYAGVLLDGAPYAWVEAPREDTRRRAVDALARLGELRQTADDLEGALAALEQAVDADPIAEELYRRLMRLQAELGRPDAVKRTYRLLARRLADLDADPDPETEQLVADLLRRPGA